MLDFFLRLLGRSSRDARSSSDEPVGRNRGASSRSGPRGLFQPFTDFSSLPAPPGSELGAAVEAVEADATGEALGTRVVKGAGWTVAGTLWTQMLGVARTVVLARLLTQDDFGVAAMALTVSSALYTLTNTGMVASVISARFDDDNQLNRYVNLVWSLEVARGLLISVLMVAGAVPFAHLYGQPRLIPILFVLALTPLCTALQNIGLFLQTRRVEMKKIMLHGLVSNSLAVGVTLGLAALTRNYWALVWGQIAGALAATVMSYVLSSFRPRPLWDTMLARRAWDFGRFQFVIGLCEYALSTMDNVLVGFFYKAQVLGVYVVAYSFCTMARSLVNNAFNAVLFPAFASAGREDDPVRLRSLVERAFSLGCVVLTAFLVPLIAFAPAAVRVFFPKWGMAVVEPMRWLLVAGWFAGLLSLFSSFFVGLNRPSIESRAKLIDAGVFLLILYPLTRFHGAVGAAQAGAITWTLASVWRWKWAGALAPGAFKRLPFLVLSSSLVGGGATCVGLLFWSLRSGLSPGSWARAFHPSSLPSLNTAWTQLLLGAPLVCALCLSGLGLLHPVARAEMGSLLGKLARSRKASGQNPA